MAQRAVIASITAFWILMNALLWRSEMSPAGRLGAPMAPERVWDRILTAPDESPLVILRKGEKIGYCRILPNVVSASTNASAADAEAPGPEGRVEKVAAYWIDIDGNLRVPGARARLRFYSHFEIAPDKQWRQFMVQLRLPPNVWELRAEAAAQRVWLEYGAGRDRWEQSWSFEELRDPSKLLSSFGLPVFIASLGLGGVAEGLQKQSFERLAAGVKWEAFEEWLNLGSTRTRVYRLRARLFADREIRIAVSRAGEILIVELPDGVRLVSEALLGLARAHHD